MDKVYLLLLFLLIIPFAIAQITYNNPNLPQIITAQVPVAGGNSSFNQTYANLLNQQCPSGYVVNGTLSNGTFTCTLDQTGGGSSYNATYEMWAYNQTTPAITYINNINATLDSRYLFKNKNDSTNSWLNFSASNFSGVQFGTPYNKIYADDAGTMHIEGGENVEILAPGTLFFDTPQTVVRDSYSIFPTYPTASGTEISGILAHWNNAYGGFGVGAVNDSGVRENYITEGGFINDQILLYSSSNASLNITRTPSGEPMNIYIDGGRLISSGSGTFENIYASNICYSNGTGCTATSGGSSLFSVANNYITNSTTAGININGNYISTNTTTKTLTRVGKGAFPNKFLFTDDNGIFITDTDGTNYSAGMFTEVSGQVLSYAINTMQTGNRVSGTTGAIFRMDTREGVPFFSTYVQSATDDQFYAPIQASSDGFSVGLGAHPGDTNTYNGNVHILGGGGYGTALVVQSEDDNPTTINQISYDSRFNELLRLENEKFELNVPSNFTKNINLASGNLTLTNGLIKLPSITLPACSSGTAGLIGRNATGFYACNSSIWNKFANSGDYPNNNGPTIKSQNTEIATSNNTAWNQTAISFSLESGKNYTFDCTLMHTGATALTGMAVNLTSTATANNIVISYDTWSSATAKVGFSATAWSSALIGTGSGGATIYPSRLSGGFETTSSGTMDLYVRSETTSAMVLKRGSYCSLIDVT